MADVKSPVVRYFIDDENRKLRALSERLGLEPEFSTYCTRIEIDPSNSNWLRWALIGKALAKNEPEFTGKNLRPGRPKRPLNEDVDIQRANMVDAEKKRIDPDNTKRISDVAAIKILSGTNVFFPKNDHTQVLQNSVTSGRKKQKSLQKEIDALLKSIREK